MPIPNDQSPIAVVLYDGSALTPGTTVDVHNFVWDTGSLSWVKETQPSGSGSGSATPAKLISAATTNATSVKASAGTLFFCSATNNGAAPAYVKWYNKASAPTVGTDTPILVFELPANSTPANGAGSNLALPSNGLGFTVGIAFAITSGIADSDATPVALNQVIVNFAVT